MKAREGMRKRKDHMITEKASDISLGHRTNLVTVRYSKLLGVTDRKSVYSQRFKEKDEWDVMSLEETG